MVFIDLVVATVSFFPSKCTVFTLISFSRTEIATNCSVVFDIIESWRRPRKSNALNFIEGSVIKYSPFSGQHSSHGYAIFNPTTPPLIISSANELPHIVITLNALQARFFFWCFTVTYACILSVGVFARMGRSQSTTVFSAMSQSGVLAGRFLNGASRRWCGQEQSVRKDVDVGEVSDRRGSR